MAKRTISDFKRKSAARLRANSTEAEALLWRHLRRWDVNGSHFRRQVVLGPYIVDFVCLSAKLVVEVDGSQHANAIGARHDEIRTRWLQAEGYRVIRFWNNEVMAQTNLVLDAIYNALMITPPRPQEAGDPPPQGEGEVARGKTP